MFLHSNHSENNVEASNRSSHYVKRSRSQMFLKIRALKNFAIFTGKGLPVSESLFNKVSGLKA